MEIPNLLYGSLRNSYVIVAFFALVSGYHSPNAEKLTTSSSKGSPWSSNNGNVQWMSMQNSPFPVIAAPMRTLRIFCWPGTRRTMQSLFYSAYFKLDIEDEAFHLYRGASSEEVEKQYKSASRWFTLLPWRDRSIRLNPFTSTCLGVDTNKPYVLTLKIVPVDPYRFLAFLTGACLLFFARRMSRNTFFHYSSGISIALVGSLLLAVFLISRMIPRKAAGISFLVGGWAVVIYFLQTLWKNFRETIYDHRNYVVAYIIIVSTITFMLIYRFGGIRNPKTMDILQWTLQIVGALIMYFSVTIEPIGIALICAAAAFDMIIHSGYNFRRFKIINKLFPPRPRKLLSPDEFEEVGRRETAKELKKLREYANSPECKSWSLVKRLSSPSRFGSFVEDGTHLSLDEVDTYEREVSFSGFDDEDEPPASAPVQPRFSSSASSHWRSHRNSPSHHRNSPLRSAHSSPWNRHGSQNGNGVDDLMDYE